MAEIKNVEKIDELIVLVSAKAIAVPTEIGITATLYMGGLIAASHNLLFERSINFVVIIQT